MLLVPIEVMDDRYEFKKLMKTYFDDANKQLVQGFELMASQLRGKLVAGGSISFHHGETHKNIIFEDFDAWLYGFRHNKAYLNSLRKINNPQVWRRPRSHQVQ